MVATGARSTVKQFHSIKILQFSNKTSPFNSIFNFTNVTYLSIMDYVVNTYWCHFNIVNLGPGKSKKLVFFPFCITVKLAPNNLTLVGSEKVKVLLLPPKVLLYNVENML